MYAVLQKTSKLDKSVSHTVRKCIMTLEDVEESTMKADPACGDDIMDSKED